MRVADDHGGKSSAAKGSEGLLAQFPAKLRSEAVFPNRLRLARQADCRAEPATPRRRIKMIAKGIGAE